MNIIMVLTGMVLIGLIIFIIFPPPVFGVVGTGTGTGGYETINKYGIPMAYYNHTSSLVEIITPYNINGNENITNIIK